MLHGTAAYLVARLPEVEVPKPDAPDSDTIIDKTNGAVSWLAGRDGSFWTIVLVGLLAAMLVKALKNPLVKGVLLGVVAVAIIGAILTK